MRARASGALARVAKLEHRRATDGVVPVARFPRIMGVDEWEAIAEPMQAALVRDTQDDPFAPEPKSVVHNPEVSQAEHERLYQEYRKHSTTGARSYLDHKREQVRKQTVRR